MNSVEWRLVSHVLEETTILLPIHVLRSVVMVRISTPTHVMMEILSQVMAAVPLALSKLGGTAAMETHDSRTFAGLWKDQ
jgi:hypothetical protein